MKKLLNWLRRKPKILLPTEAQETPKRPVGYYGDWEDMGYFDGR